MMGRRKGVKEGRRWGVCQRSGTAMREVGVGGEEHEGRKGREGGKEGRGLMVAEAPVLKGSEPPPLTPPPSGHGRQLPPGGVSARPLPQSPRPPQRSIPRWAGWQPPAVPIAMHPLCTRRGRGERHRGGWRARWCLPRPGGDAHRRGEGSAATTPLTTTTAPGEKALTVRASPAGRWGSHRLPGLWCGRPLPPVALRSLASRWCHARWMSFVHARNSARYPPMHGRCECGVWLDAWASFNLLAKRDPASGPLDLPAGHLICRLDMRWRRTRLGRGPGHRHQIPFLHQGPILEGPSTRRHPPFSF